MSQITFGTDGWRAVIADDFTFSNVEKVACAIGRYVNERGQKSGNPAPMLVGYDTRFLADSFARRAAQVFISMGIPARLADRDLPTPVIAYATRTEATVGAVQLTASHNPPEYCGMKYIPEYAGPATNEITDGIVSHLSEPPLQIDVHSIAVPTFSAKEPYMKALAERVDFERIARAGLKIGVDCLYSTSREYLDEALKMHGVDARILHNWRDPLFGGMMPEPRPQYLKELSKLVQDEKLNCGLATDGDADRFAVIDENGVFVSGNQILAMLTSHLIKNRKESGGIVKTVATTHFLDCLARAYGLEIYETPVGFKYIGELMRKHDILIGGEESGGCSVKGHIPEKDGILCNLLIVEMLAYEKKSLMQIWSELVAETGVEFAYRRKDIRLTAAGQKNLVEKLLQQPFERVGDSKIIRTGRLDGFKYYFEDGSWILVRPSGTEPLVRFYFESPSSQRVDALKAEFDQMIDKLLEGIGASLLPVH
jgi:phosphomannomutase